MAGIPDLNGNSWSSTSPSILDETEVANGGLFLPGSVCLQKKFDTFVTPHNSGYVYSLTDPNNLGTRTYASRRAGILTIRMAYQPGRCNTARVGIVGLIAVPVTG